MSDKKMTKVQSYGRIMYKPSDAELRREDKRNRADEEYFSMLEEKETFESDATSITEHQKKWRELGGVVYKNTKGETVVLVGNTTTVLE